MTHHTTIWRRYISFGALAIALIALPYSIKVCHAGIIIFLIAWASEGGWQEKFLVLKNSTLLQLFGALFLLQVVGVFYTEDKTSGWMGIEKKIFVFILPFALATLREKFTTTEINRLLYAFVISCLIGTIICLASAYSTTVKPSQITYLSTTNFDSLYPDVPKTWLTFSYTSLAGGIELHPTFFSLYLAFCIVFLMEKTFKSQLSKRLRLLHTVVYIYLSIFIVCLSSRVIILCLFFLFIGFILKNLFTPRRKRSIVIASVTALLFVALLTNPVTRFRSFQEFSLTSLHVATNTEYKTSIAIRLSLWWLALKSVDLENFMFGIGSDNVTIMMETTATKYSITNILRTYDPHNQYLYTLLSSGIVGLLALLLILTVPLGAALKSGDYLLLTFNVMIASVFTTESAFELQKGIVFILLIYSLILFQLGSYQLLSFSKIFEYGKR